MLQCFPFWVEGSFYVKYTSKYHSCQIASARSYELFLHHNRDLRRWWEDAKQQHTQLSSMVLVINIFLPTPCFVHRVDVKPLVFRECTEYRLKKYRAPAQQSRSRSYKKRRWAPAQFDRGYEPLLKREGAYVYTKEGTRVPSLNSGSFVCTRWSKQGVGGKSL